MVVTPKLPRPALRPSAVPCRRFGKKVLMLDIEQAKLPPPIPDSSAINWNTHSGVALSCKRDAGADGRNHQQRGGQEDGVAATGDADEE